jgi:hypothetical protein
MICIGDKRMASGTVRDIRTLLPKQMEAITIKRNVATLLIENLASADTTLQTFSFHHFSSSPFFAG